MTKRNTIKVQKAVMAKGLDNVKRRISENEYDEVLDIRLHTGIMISDFDCDEVVKIINEM